MANEMCLRASARSLPFVVANENLQITWTPAPGYVLQQSASLSNPDWQTVTGSANTNRITVPTTNTSGFFQLFKP